MREEREKKKKEGGERRENKKLLFDFTTCYNTVACCKKNLILTRLMRSVFLVFGVLNAKNLVFLAFGTPDANALSCLYSILFDIIKIPATL